MIFMKKNKQMDDKDLETVAGGSFPDLVGKLPFSKSMSSLTPHSRTCPRCGQTYTVDPKLNKISHIRPKRDGLSFSFNSKNS